MREFEKLGVDATQAMQAAARRVDEDNKLLRAENGKLRALLRKHYGDDATIDACLSAEPEGRADGTRRGGLGETSTWPTQDPHRRTLSLDFATAYAMPGVQTAGFDVDAVFGGGLAWAPATAGNMASPVVGPGPQMGQGGFDARQGDASVQMAEMVMGGRHYVADGRYNVWPGDAQRQQ